MGFGVYIHFPYCRARCPYCDFAIHVRRAIPHERYAAAIEAELRKRAPRFAGRVLETIYFGGGTPSLWDPECVARVIAAVRHAFPSPPGSPRSEPREITLEANPDDLPRARLAAFRAAGIDRLSLGAQSFDAAQLVTLGRLHSAAQTRRAVEDARAEGIGRLSVDLMYGLPGQTPAHLEAELDALVALDVPHLSAYQLTVEEHTPFAAYRRRGSLALLGDDPLADMADTVDRRLADAGYVHYEISSYARRASYPGSRAQHNSLYWSGGEWLGLGSSAHSFRRTAGGGERWSNLKNVDRYMEAARLPQAHASSALEDSEGAEQPRAPLGDAMRVTDPLLVHVEPLDEEALAREAMWLGLRRLDEGVDRRHYADRFGADPCARFAPLLGELVRAGLVEIGPASVRLTRRGALLADEVGVRFL